MAGADLRRCGIGYFGWLPGAAAVPTHIPSYFLADISYRYQALPLAHQPAHSPNPKPISFGICSRFVSAPSKLKSDANLFRLATSVLLMA
ncbi:hypothetical protein [Cronobacter sp. JZ38]|uniref:hypothetical protein n=1 Tax=Cronobacter sp. JZ38 TaxID=1906275 RepID=UPI001556A4EF|nr:hypothetical protein [Cronobacter sp. JZ38]